MGGLGSREVGSTYYAQGERHDLRGNHESSKIYCTTGTTPRLEEKNDSNVESHQRIDTLVELLLLVASRSVHRSNSSFYAGTTRSLHSMHTLVEYLAILAVYDTIILLRARRLVTVFIILILLRSYESTTVVLLVIVVLEYAY